MPNQSLKGNLYLPIVRLWVKALSRVVSIVQIRVFRLFACSLFVFFVLLNYVNRKK